MVGRRLLFIVFLIFLVPFSSAQTPVVIPFHEAFDDASYSSRNWYDLVNMQSTSVESVSGNSLPISYSVGTTGPVLARLIFAETEELYIGYWVKYSSNWVDKVSVSTQRIGP